MNIFMKIGKAIFFMLNNVCCATLSLVKSGVCVVLEKEEKWIMEKWKNEERERKKDET